MHRGTEGTAHTALRVSTDGCAQSAPKVCMEGMRPMILTPMAWASLAICLLVCWINVWSKGDAPSGELHSAL